MNMVSISNTHQMGKGKKGKDETQNHTRHAQSRFFKILNHKIRTERSTTRSHQAKEGTKVFGLTRTIKPGGQRSCIFYEVHKLQYSHKC